MLIKLRVSKGFTQEQMAKKMGISITAYHLYEKGKRNIPRKHVDKILELLGVIESSELFEPSMYSLKRKEI